MRQWCILFSILFTPMWGCMSVVGRANAVKSCLFRWPATTAPRSCLAPWSRKMIYHQHTTASNWMESGGTGGVRQCCLHNVVLCHTTWHASSRGTSSQTVISLILGSRLGHGLGDTVVVLFWRKLSSILIFAWKTESNISNSFHE